MFDLNPFNSWWAMIIQKLHDALVDGSKQNIDNMFNGFNTQLSSIGNNVSKTPSSWNSGLYASIHNFSNSVIVPIALLIIVFVFMYELNSMIMEKNSFIDFDPTMFLKILIKLIVCVVVASRCFDIVTMIFDAGGWMASKIAEIMSSNNIAMTTGTAGDAMKNKLASLQVNELWWIFLVTLLLQLTMTLLGLFILVILYTRMIEIYLYISVAPIPFSTFMNKEWSNIGTNYIRSLGSFIVQGFFIMVCVSIYDVLATKAIQDISGQNSTVNSLTGSDITKTLFQLAVYVVILCLAIKRSGSIAKSICGAS